MEGVKITELQQPLNISWLYTYMPKLINFWQQTINIKVEKR